MPFKPIASSEFLARELTPPDLELVLGLTENARSRDEIVRLVIRDDETCVRLACEPAPMPAELLADADFPNVA